MSRGGALAGGRYIVSYQILSSFILCRSVCIFFSCQKAYMALLYYLNIILLLCTADIVCVTYPPKGTHPPIHPVRLLYLCRDTAWLLRAADCRRRRRRRRLHRSLRVYGSIIFLLPAARALLLAWAHTPRCRVYFVDRYTQAEPRTKRITSINTAA